MTVRNSVAVGPHATNVVKSRAKSVKLLFAVMLAGLLSLAAIMPAFGQNSVVFPLGDNVAVNNCQDGNPYQTKVEWTEQVQGEGNICTAIVFDLSVCEAGRDCEPETGDGGDGGDGGTTGDVEDSANADGGDSGPGGDGGPGGGVGGDGGGSGAVAIINSGGNNTIETTGGNGGPGTCTHNCFGGEGAESGDGGSAEAGDARSGDNERAGDGAPSGSNNLENNPTVVITDEPEDQLK